jgi:hypothetical protein
MCAEFNIEEIDSIAVVVELERKEAAQNKTKGHGTASVAVTRPQLEQSVALSFVRLKDFST